MAPDDAQAAAIDDASLGHSAAALGDQLVQRICVGFPALAPHQRLRIARTLVALVTDAGELAQADPYWSHIVTVAAAEYAAAVLAQRV